MELTKEHFDTVIATSIEASENRLMKYVDTQLTTRLEEQKTEILEHVDTSIRKVVTESIEELAGMTARGFREVHVHLDTLGERVSRLEEAVH